MRLSGMQSVLSAAILSFAAAAMGQTAVAPAASGAPGAPETVARVKVPALDVISVKPNKSGGGGSSWGATPDGVMGKNLAVHMMLVSAYMLNDNQLINEPAWANTERFDFTGKVADVDAAAVSKLTPDQKRVFFEQVLKERFGLVAHHETRELPEYALVPAKGGVKLEDGKPDPRASPGMKPNTGSFSTGMSGGAEKVIFSGVPVSRLLPILSNETGRTVVDKSGLTGKYNFTLSWRPAMAQAGADGAADSTPDLFTATQEQLGLKLEPTKGPVDVLVVDHIERPAEN
jgi:uncharacterized protein (TIGR03435 family)